MKRLTTMLIGLLALCSMARAEPTAYLLSLAMGATTNSTVSSAGPVGYIEEIQVNCSEGSYTGTVTITVQPVQTNVAAYNIATNSVVGELRFYPNVDYTSVAGAAQTSDPPRRIMLYRDTVSMQVNNSPTNVTWYAVIKLNDK